MRILSRLKKQPAIDDVAVGEIQERVRAMRHQIGRREIELADLFALLREDERPVLREIEPVKRPELERFWPNQVPATLPAPAAAEAPKVTYEWQAPRVTGLATTP